MRVRFERITAAQEPYPHINDTQTKAQVIYFNPSIAHNSSRSSQHVFRVFNTRRAHD